MAKKSTAGKRAGASRRPAASKDSHVTFIRTPSASTATLTSESAKETTQPASTPPPARQPQRSAPAPRATQPAARATQPAARGATATPAKTPSTTSPATASVPSATPARVATTTAARPSAARPTARVPRPSQRSTRTVSMVTAEHYTYVKRDLVMIAVLAGAMFAFIIVVYFYLRAQGQV